MTRKYNPSYWNGYLRGRMRRRRNEADRYAICGIVSESGPNGEPLACGYQHGHEGKHAWATLPTFQLHVALPAESDDG
jgi:hypothetical protein